MSNINDFEITKAGKLKRYKGNENIVIVPENVVEVTYPGTFRSPTGGPSSIILPEGLKKISFDAFDDCLNLTEIDIPDSVSHIEPGAIDFRCKIKKINIPANIKQIKGAISECESIWDIIVPDDAVIKEKCWHAFDPNSKIKYCLTNIRRGIELTQTEIAFIKRSFSVAAEMAILHKDTESLSAIFAMKKKVDLDLIDSLLEKNNDSQEARAFILDYKNKYYSNENISQHFDEKQEKEFDPSKRTISDWRKIYKFPISPNDGKVTIDGYKGNEKTVIIPGEIGKYSVISVSKKAFKDQKEITEVIIGEGIKEIGSETFIHCISLEKITLPNSLSEINSSAFEGCISLTEISIPGNVKVISGWAFRSCIELKKVMICEGVSEISSCAFQGCKELETIYIPNSVTNIEIYPFMDCKKLTIHAPAGSYAETYAKENNIPFIAE